MLLLYFIIRDQVGAGQGTGNSTVPNLRKILQIWAQFAAKACMRTQQGTQTST